MVGELFLFFQKQPALSFFFRSTFFSLLFSPLLSLSFSLSSLTPTNPNPPSPPNPTKSSLRHQHLLLLLLLDLRGLHPPPVLLD